MRRAAWGWVVVFLISQLLLQGCSRLGDPASTPPANPGVPLETPESAGTAVVDAPGDTPPTAIATAGQKPPKPEEAQATAVVPETGAPLEEPRPTPDPALDSWTVLFYMSAGEGSDAAALRILNEMEAAALSGKVNVLVQLDRNLTPDSSEAWRGARRYLIAGDEDPSTVNSQLLEELGPSNMGDPDTLTDFVAWSQQAYPANRYALILWGASGGWRGLLQDASDGDDLSMSDLGGALQRAHSAAGQPALDLIVFDAPLTANLEVLNAVQPYADYAVAAPGLLTSNHWDYGSILQLFFQEDQATAQGLASQMAAVDGTESSAVSPFPNAMVAVDLRQLPAVNAALQDLSEAMVQNAALSVAAIGDARRFAQVTTLTLDNQTDPLAAVDLGQFALELARLTPLADLSRRAVTVGEVLSSAVIASKATGARPEEARGVTVAFLPLQDVDDPDYGAMDVTSWQQALHAYYEASAEVAFSAQGQVATQGGESAGVQKPVLLGLELRAANLDGASLVGLLQNAEEGRRLLYLDKLAANDASREGSPGWPDGVTQQEVIWDTAAPYVSDGANGDFAPLWPVGSFPDLRMVPAQYVGAGQGSGEAVLLFDGVSGQLNSVWESDSARLAPRQLSPSAGDSFQLYDVFLEQDGALRYEPGVTLVYSDGVDLNYETFPLPSGNYQAGLLATGPTGRSLLAQADLLIDNEGLLPGYQAYLNAQYGLQFLYPLTWPEPVFDGRRATTAARQRGPVLTVSLYPQYEGASAAQLKTETKAAFGDLDVLYEESVKVDGEDGLLTAYGYNGPDGPHTGIFITFIQADRNLGYVVDVDGLALDEATTVEVANRLVESWDFRPVSAGSWPDEWVTTELDPLEVTLPAGYRHETLDNGWELFKEGKAFLAVRDDAISGGGRTEIASRWAEVASRGVQNYEVDNPGSFALAGTVWSRVDFRYDGDDGPVAGTILATIYGGREIVAWGEAPAESFDQLLNDHFLVAVAGALPAVAGSALVLFETTFDDAVSWGVGRQEGATGAVTEGVYDLSVEAPRGFFSTSAGVTLSDGLFEVEATQRAGSLDSGYGLLLRADISVQSFYAFEISADGFVWIGWCELNCAEATPLVGEGWFASAAVNQGLDATNTLRVEAQGSRLQFYVNDTQVGEFEDDAATSGDVGLFAETLGTEGLRVQFDDLRVLAY
ncbi:MAG TPA: clostripain-related cysteine peptidase [Candidatus Binatia bacterium]|nr:clostripain-related cysteine peptidase [Candidatus Binatia bacterium]